MPPNDDQGLGISLLIYAVAIVCAFALFVLPVYWANAPAVYENSGQQHFTQMLEARAARGHYPLARLKHQQIVDPALVAEMNAKAKAKRVQREATGDARRATTRRPAHKREDYADARPAQSRAQPPNPFSVFFSLF
jgi:hypothetical protein